MLGSSNGDSVPEVFVRHRMSFAQYGAYCANLPQAQAKIVEACRDPIVAADIRRCEMLDSARFKLGELLTVPMQRVLKYPLMLRELAKLSVKESASDGLEKDKEAFEQAVEAMQDVAAYINECKRDAEIAHTVEHIVRSVDGFAKSAANALSDCGRFLKDGELRLTSSSSSKSTGSRYVFLFEKCLVVCKRKRTGDRFFGVSSLCSSFQVTFLLHYLNVDAAV